MRLQLPGRAGHSGAFHINAVDVFIENSGVILRVCLCFLMVSAEE